jgi:hypothetical protein
MNDLTLFTTCKPFVGEAAQTQSNALMTWHALGFRAIICGPEPGAAEAAKQFDMLHIPEVRRTSRGIPYIDSIFGEAEAASKTPWVAYLNSDIILTETLKRSVLSALSKLDANKPTLLTFRRRNIPVSGSLEREDWPTTIEALSREYGSWDQSNAIDIFVYTPGLFGEIPELAVGYMGWDNWLMWKAKQVGATVIDGSLEAALFHPIHGYSSDGTGLLNRSQSQQAIDNRRATEGKKATFDTATTHMLAEGEITPLTEAGSRRIKQHCAPDYDREFLAGLEYLSNSLPLRSSAEILDCCRTILWRQERFYPLMETNEFDMALVQPAILRAREDAKQGKHGTSVNEIEDLVAHFFTRRLKMQAPTKKLYIWGAGARGSRLSEFLLRHGIEVEGLIDRNPSKTGKKIGNLQVLGSDLTTAGNPGDFHIIIASMYAGEIASDFEEKGLKEGSDFSA